MSAISEKEQSISANPLPNEPQACHFYSSSERIEAAVSAIIAPSNVQIQDIQLVHIKDKNIIRVFMPREMNHYWNNDAIEWDLLAEIVTNEYRRQVLDEKCESVSDTAKIVFRQIEETITCMADVKLSHKKNVIKGFIIKKKQGDGEIIIKAPKWMGYWNDSMLSWPDLCSLIKDEYIKYSEKDGEISGVDFMPIEASDSAESNVPPEESDSLEHAPKQIKEKDEFGRIKNAENSPFVFYPRTVLRSVNFSVGKGADSKKNLFDLVSAINKGSLGGIGPFEINILEWIAKLRYVSSTMLLDLIKAGYVSFGWRSDVTQAKLAKIISRMADYGLITLTRFMTVNDDGSLDNNTYAIMRIITLGRNGSILLHELGKHTSRYNAFDIFQDGNTVKRFLTANQWLVYWLKTYKNEIGEEYETSCIIHLKGAEYVGARIYATVTINGYPIIAEPVRRVEELEIESNKQWLREKLERLSLMFDNLDQLYHGKNEISFPQRPIIVIICENDEHILEARESIKPILPDLKNQEIWFTSDLRIFNYNKIGERFLRFSNELPYPVNLKQVFGIDNEEDNAVSIMDES